MKPTDPSSPINDPKSSQYCDNHQTYNTTQNEGQVTQHTDNFYKAIIEHYTEYKVID